MATQSADIASALSALHLETADTVDLDAPFTSDRILEVRSGRMQPLPGLTILSGIDKSACRSPVHVGPGGIVGDEHDYTFHGGPDKAVHGCKKTHSHKYLWSNYYTGPIKSREGCL